jgi:8-oxo-dGTP diphosphatase
MPSSPPEHQIFEVGVKALIVRDDRLLLLKRRDYHKWEMPGGRINMGETIRQALRRELAEELPGSGNFAIRDIAYAHQADFVLDSGHQLLLLFFTVKTSSVDQALALSPEHEASMWVSADELHALEVQPHIRKAALLALGSKG